MKVYLAGPMRGYPLFNFPAFKAAAKKLRSMGHEVFAPHERDLETGFNPAKDEAKPMAHYMAIDLPEVCKAEAVIVLPGWEKSKGCKMELSLAFELGKDVFAYETMHRITDTSAGGDVVSATIAERGKVYGDPQLSHENIGLAWTGLLQQHYGVRLDHSIPSWLVSLMMASFKNQRAARVYHADNFTDARAYLRFAESDQKPK